VEFRILGPLEVSDDDGREVSPAGRRPRALLALLLLHANEVVSGDHLIEELWGENSPDDGAAALRVNVSRLRKALPQDVLATRAPGYVVRVRPDELDLHRFERLVDEAGTMRNRGSAAAASDLLHEALSLWRGAPLADSATSPSPRRQSHGSTRSGSRRSSSESTPTSRSAATPD
jgi:DNA-binding SARP family transcriptional activator